MLSRLPSLLGSANNRKIYPSALYALAVFGNSRLVDFDAFLIDRAATADCIIDVICLDVVRQSAQGTIAEQQVDVFERFLASFWK